MTINELQSLLIREIEDLTNDIYITDTKGELVPFKGYPQNINMSESYQSDVQQSKDKWFPYFLVRMDKAEYRKKEADGRNQAHLFIEVNICDSEYDRKGFYTLTAILQRIISRFQKESILGAFCCDQSMNLIFQKEYEFPYYKGEVEMFWNLPDIQLERINEW